MDLSALERELEKLKEHFHTQKGKRDKILEDKGIAEAEAKSVSALIEELTQVQLFLQKVSTYARVKAKEKIEDIVTNALQFVFGPDYAFAVLFTANKKRVECDFYVTTVYGSKVVTLRPQDAKGGGVVDVVSLALRFAMLEIHRPYADGPIILDEPFKHVSNNDFIVNVGRFLKHMGQKFNRQIIIITHNDHLSSIADKNITVQIVEGKSEILV